MNTKYKKLAKFADDLIEAGKELEDRNYNLEQAHMMDRSLLSDMGEKLRRQQELLDDAIEIAGRMSVLFPATETLNALSSRQERKSYEVHIVEPMEFAYVSDAQSGFTAKVESLKLMIASVQPDRMRCAVHSNVRFSDGEICYGATETAIHSMPHEVFVKRMVNEVGRALVKKLFKAL